MAPGGSSFRATLELVEWSSQSAGAVCSVLTGLSSRRRGGERGRRLGLKLVRRYFRSFVKRWANDLFFLRCLGSESIGRN